MRDPHGFPSPESPKKGRREDVTEVDQHDERAGFESGGRRMRFIEGRPMSSEYRVATQHALQDWKDVVFQRAGERPANAESLGRLRPARFTRRKRPGSRAPALESS
jgi:hypothetical protein